MPSEQWKGIIAVSRGGLVPGALLARELGIRHVTINKDLNKTYDGKPVSLSDRDITVTGSTGMVSFTWEKKNGSLWEVLASAPSEAGTYRVSVQVEADKNHEAADSDKKEFRIQKSQTAKLWWFNDVTIGICHLSVLLLKSSV